VPVPEAEAGAGALSEEDDPLGGRQPQRPDARPRQ
jgi:hypothetical protein